jgi:hypothetical protein
MRSYTDVAGYQNLTKTYVPTTNRNRDYRFLTKRSQAFSGPENVFIFMMMKPMNVELRASDF